MSDLSANSSPLAPPTPVPGKDFPLDAPPPASRELDQIALGWYAQGKTYRQIAQLMDISLSGAYLRVQRGLALQRLRTQDFHEELRRQSMLVLQRGVQPMLEAAARGDLRAYRALIQFTNTSIRLAKLGETRRRVKRAARQRLKKGAVTPLDPQHGRHGSDCVNPDSATV